MPQLISEEKMKEFRDWGKDFLLEILDVYISSTREQLNKSRKAYLANDLKSLHHHLHTIKGATANIGFTEAYNVILPLEKSCRSGDHSSFPEEIEKIDNLVKRIEDWRGGLD